MTAIPGLQNIPPCKEGLNLQSELSGFKDSFISDDYTAAADRLARFAGKLECLDTRTLLDRVDKEIAQEIHGAASVVRNQSATVGQELQACQTFNALVNPALLPMEIVLHTGKSEIYKAFQNAQDVGKQCAFYYPKVSFGLWAHDPATNEFVRQTIFCTEGTPKTCWAITDYLWQFAFDTKNYGVGCYLAEWMESGFVCGRGVKFSSPGKLMLNSLGADGKTMTSKDIQNTYVSPLKVLGSDIVKNISIKCDNLSKSGGGVAGLGAMGQIDVKGKGTIIKSGSSTFPTKTMSSQGAPSGGGSSFGGGQAGGDIGAGGAAAAGSQAYIEEMLNATNINKLCPFKAGGPWKETGKKTIRGYRCSSDYFSSGSGSLSGASDLTSSKSGVGGIGGKGGSVGTSPGDGDGKGSFSSCPARFDGSGSGYSGPIVGYAAAQHIGARPGCGGGVSKEADPAAASPCNSSSACADAAADANENLEDKKAEIKEGCIAGGGADCSDAAIDDAVDAAGDDDLNNGVVDNNLTEATGNEAAFGTNENGFGTAYDGKSAGDVATHMHEQLHDVYTRLGVPTGGANDSNSPQHQAIGHVCGNCSVDPEGGGGDCTGKSDQMNSMCGLGIDLSWKPPKSAGRGAVACQADAPDCKDDKNPPSGVPGYSTGSGYSGPTNKDPMGGLGGDTWGSESPGGGGSMPCEVGMFGKGLGAIDCEMFNPGMSAGSDASTCNRGSVVDMAQAAAQAQAVQAQQDDRCGAVSSEMECSGSAMGAPKVLSAAAASKSMKDLKKSATMMKSP